MSKITFPDGMLHAEKNPALSQFVEDLRNKKKYSTEDVATKRVDEKNEVGLPVKNPVNKDNRFEPTKKPTTAFVAGLVVTALLMLFGIYLLANSGSGYLWSYTWVILPSIVLCVADFALLYNVAKTTGSLRRFTVSAISTIIITLIVALCLIVIGSYLWIFACGYLIPVIIVAYSFIKAYMGS